MFLLVVHILVMVARRGDYCFRLNVAAHYTLLISFVGTYNTIYILNKNEQHWILKFLVKKIVSVLCKLRIRY